ncbi:alpha/beta hydrolase [Diaminobutyricimonas aerilata]|uniref:alpha/beta hydrolase n=1 Tax=Diaminobutyricimonas aerilata TaxID=1162967 RepID=UPI0012FD9263|nr:alpha/beta hydrolase-fold protein [Diaminobutyricimonas aerilata]
MLLHGSGSDPQSVLRLLHDEAERRGMLVLAPKSMAYTWDAILGGVGPDIRSIQEALDWMAERFRLDRARIMLSGFSDGASYALTVGLVNGDVFSRIGAFSPGFLLPGPRTGRPSIFVSHGLADPVLPIDRCSRVLVPGLIADGYEVDFREFADGHTVPREMVAAALDPLAG